MAKKLNLIEKFILEIPTSETENDIIKGTMRPLTKDEQKEFEKMFETDKNMGLKLQKKSSRLQKLFKRLEIAEKREDYDMQEKILIEIENLEDEIIKETEELQNLDTHEKTAKQRLKLSLKCEIPEMMAKLIEACDLVGYKKVLDTIQEDIDEGKQKGIES